MWHGHSPWKPLMAKLKDTNGERERRILEAKEGSGRATLRKLNGGKSYPRNYSGLISRPFPPDIPLNHLKTANYQA